jgi:hypothetical protein
VVRQSVQLLAAICTITASAIGLCVWLTDPPPDDMITVIHVRDKYIFQDNYYLVDYNGTHYLVAEDDYYSVLRWRDGD